MPLLLTTACCRLPLAAEITSPRLMSSSSAVARGGLSPASSLSVSRLQLPSGGIQNLSQRSGTQNLSITGAARTGGGATDSRADLVAQTPPRRRERRELGQRQRPLAELSQTLAARRQQNSDTGAAASAAAAPSATGADAPSERQQDASSADANAQQALYDMRDVENATEQRSQLSDLQQQQQQTQTQSQSATGVRQEVWGTDLNIQNIDSDIMHFLETFTEQNGTEPLYPRLIRESQLLAHDYIALNCSHLRSVQPQMYRHLVTYPAEIVERLDSAVHLLLMRYAEEQAHNDGVVFDAEHWESVPLFVRPYGLESVHNMRALNPEDIDSLVSTKGMVIRVNAVLPEMLRAFFRCSQCAHVQWSRIEDGTIQEPQQCRGACQSKYTYQLIHNRCHFEDRQIIKVQETPDSIPEGQTPHSVKIAVYESMVDCVKPGDRVQITGIYKAASHRLTSTKMTQSTVYKTHLDGLHIQILQSNPKASDGAPAATTDDSSDTTVAQMMNDSHVGAEDNALAEQRKLQLDALGHEANIYSRLVASLAPSIYDMDDVKRGILCQLFGGACSESGAKSGQFRGEINILMCGDPGTSKSQLLSYVNKIAPRGIYTSGKGSSAVGLTASVTRDVESRELQLESGALVLSDRGICCIDEFDKMNDATRSILHEVMEQQTVSIAKAGIVCSLNARTSILASANPKQSRYNPSLSVVENIQIMPTLLSRFDLIYLILDQVNDTKDRRLARHLTQLYWRDDVRAEDKAQREAAPDAPAALIDMSTLKDYIAYARANCKPVLSSDAQTLLIDGYLALRRIGQNSSNKVVTATPRQLEALIRLSEALARMRLSPTVDASDVQEARRLMDVATQTAATDPRTGTIDMDLLTTGHSARDRKSHAMLIDAVRDAVQQQSRSAFQASVLLSQLNEQVQQAGEQRVTLDQLRECLQELDSEGLVKFAGTGRHADQVRKV